MVKFFKVNMLSSFRRQSLSICTPSYSKLTILNARQRAPDHDRPWREVRNNERRTAGSDGKTEAVMDDDGENAGDGLAVVREAPAVDEIDDGDDRAGR